MTVASDLAAFLTDVQAEDLPPRALDLAAMTIASTLASAAVGMKIDSARIVRAMIRERGGRQESSIWFDAGPKLPAVSAVQINAMLSDAAASDDSDLRNIVHAGTPATAAAIAFAEREGATGEETLTAIVLGIELAGRIGEAITPGFKERGFHGCLGAAFAATAAAGRILKLNAEQMTHAIALTATSIGGIATAADTSISREWHAGLAALHGANAVLAAQRGYTGEPAVLEAPRGFFEAFGGVAGPKAAAIALKGMGRSWDIETDHAFKLMPGGHPYHAIAEAAAEAMKQRNARPDQIEGIIIKRPGVAELTGPRFPANLIDAAHSPAYFAAAGAADGGFNWGHARPEKITESRIHDLAAKVTVVDEPVANAKQYRQGATVSIRTRDRSYHTGTVYEPKGSAALGVNWDDIADKYRMLMPESEPKPGAIEASLTLLRAFRRAPGVDPLLRVIVPDSREGR